MLLTASLSTAVNAVKGLTREEMVECLASPLREPSEFLSGAFEAPRQFGLVPASHTRVPVLLRPAGEPDEAPREPTRNDAPENQIDDLIRNRLSEMFKATRKTAYQEVLPLPPLDEVADECAAAAFS